MDFMSTYEMSVSLWDMIVENIASNEVFEVKSFLGEDLVDQSIELRSEISTLLDIYKNFADEQGSGDCSLSFLPEPPEVRERLLKEIQFFVSGIREQAKAQGRNPEKALGNHNKDIIDYVYECTSSRPTTSGDSGRSTARSSFQSTPNSDRLNEILLKDKLNYMAFDDVQSKFRQLLHEEVYKLNLDLLEMQMCLNVKDNSGKMSQPTIAELKKERHELEQILLQSSRMSKRSCSKMTSSRSVESSKDKKSLFSPVPDNENCIYSISTASAKIKSPPKLKPIENSESVNNGSYISEYVESPLDFGLPPEETLLSPSPSLLSLAPSVIHNTNNSSINTIEIDETKSYNKSVHKPVIMPCDKPAKFNSAQRFRQRILQNRKETCNY